jgi:uncharacterized protein (TIGR01244 family)
MLALPQAPTKETIPGATNVTRVDATIACAGATSPEAFADIKQRGFVSIVNLRREQEPGADIPAAREAAAKTGLTFIHIPVDGANPDPAAADAFIKAVTNPAHQPVFVHCASANRVAAMWLIKRVVVDGWTVERALDEATQIGLTHEALKRFAVDYATAHRK